MLDFLSISRLCGGEEQGELLQDYEASISRLCGGEACALPGAVRAISISRLCGGEGHLSIRSDVRRRR